MIRIAVDAMGGDYAPAEMVAGAVEAVPRRQTGYSGWRWWDARRRRSGQSFPNSAYEPGQIEVVNATPR